MINPNHFNMYQNALDPRYIPPYELMSQISKDISEYKLKNDTTEAHFYVGTMIYIYNLRTDTWVNCYSHDDLMRKLGYNLND